MPLIQGKAPASATPPSAKEREALLRRQAQARAVIAKAMSLVNKDQMAEADRLISTLPVSGGTGLMGMGLFRTLGDWAAIQGNWRRAAEYYSALVPLDRLEMPLPATQDYNKNAVVLAQMNDRRAYEDFCREYIKQFGDSDEPAIVERMVKSCSLPPANASLLAALLPSAEKLAESTRADTDPNHWALPWQCLALTTFEYRHGHYAEAVNWGNRCLSFQQDSPMERVAAAEAILAMSYHHLGQAEQARSALAKSRELVEERWKSPFPVNHNTRDFWYDWFLARILEREAVAMIERGAPVKKNE